MSIFQLVCLGCCALLIGFSKTGIQGAVTVSIPLMAVAFGAKESTGVILPMLCFADLIAVAYYRRDADWKLVLRLLPSAVLGFFVALGVDSLVPRDAFGLLMASAFSSGLFLRSLPVGNAQRKSPARVRAHFCSAYSEDSRQ